MKKKNEIQSKITNRRGFTLIETFVAILILTLAIGGPMTIAQKGLTAAFYARDRMVAYYLAQDAMEYIRNVRDTNFLEGTYEVPGGWLTDLGPCINQKCFVDTLLAAPASIVACPGGTTCPPVKQDSVTYAYGYGTGWPATQFTREIQLTPVSLPAPASADDQIDVVITITWPSRVGNVQTVKLTDALFKWQ